ncbi:hypothetical protein AbraIFM66950_006329 [Aspergillus brasiliensis]|nr:hypothetical protein AbraIFM66950_006329 [Aspergillus brasiliensis]
MSQNWLITGSSSGFGASLALAALHAGHKVLATARNPSTASLQNPEITSLGGIWIPLDVNNPETPTQIQSAITTHFDGIIDVVVNNAGYSLLGSIEDMSESEIESQFNTNVYGPIRVLKVVLPFMRKRKAGTVVNISSSAGVDGAPGVLLIEPGYFRTNFFSAFVEPAAGLNADYVGTPVEAALKLIKAKHGKQEGDPDKAAQRILEVVTGTGMAEGREDLKGFLRVPLGPDCWKRFSGKIEGVKANLEIMKDIAHSTNFDE